MDETTCGCPSIDVEAEGLELIAFEKDAQSALEEAQIKLTRAGINMHNNRAYVRALEGEIADGQSDLVDARAEQVSYDAEYQAMFSRVQSLTAAQSLDHPEDLTRL